MATLFFRKDRKCWYGNVVRGRRRVRVRLDPNKRKSQRMLARLVLEEEKAARATGLQIDPDLAFDQYTRDRYLPWAKAHKSTSMHKREELAVRTWLRLVGDSPLVAITRWTAESFRTRRIQETSKQTKRKPSARTVNADVGMLSFMLGKAVEWGLLETNPLVGLRRLPENKKAPRWLTSEEVSSLLAVVPDRLRVYVLVAINTGLRRGELRRLEWADVDLAERVLMVRHKGDEHTKSRKERVVDLNEVALEALRGHRAVMRKRFRKLPDRVFVTQVGTPLGGNLLRDIKKVYSEAGISGANIHSLRHTFGAHAAMAGIDLPTLKELMGHSDIKTTMIYVHVDREHRRKVVNRLELGRVERGGEVIPMVRERG